MLKISKNSFVTLGALIVSMTVSLSQPSWAEEGLWQKFLGGCVERVPKEYVTNRFGMGGYYRPDPDLAITTCGPISTLFSPFGLLSTVGEMTTGVFKSKEALLTHAAPYAAQEMSGKVLPAENAALLDSARQLIRSESGAWEDADATVLNREVLKRGTAKLVE